MNRIVFYYILDNDGNTDCPNSKAASLFLSLDGPDYCFCLGQYPLS